MPKKTPPIDRAAPLLSRIEAALPSLRPSEQRVARFVLAQPHQVVTLSFPSIAEKTAVSQPSVARFCRALGIEGFRDFKLLLAQSLARGTPHVHRDVSPRDSMADVGAKVFERAIAAFTEARSHLDAASLERAVVWLASARKIEFWGAGNSGIVAQDAQHKFFRLGVPTAAYADAHIHAMSAALLSKSDVVVAISGSGRAAGLIRSVEIARESGARIVAITTAGSALAKRADLLIAAEPMEDLEAFAPMTSRLVHLTILDALAIGVALKRGPALAQRLKRAKAAVAERMVSQADMRKSNTGAAFGAKGAGTPRQH